jgi:glycine betaine/proline transport system substrate-binding protein
LGLLLAACSGSGVDQAATSTEDTAATAECGEVGIAMHAWVGYTATANVLTEIAKKEFGCTVNQVELAEAGVLKTGAADVGKNGLIADQLLKLVLTDKKD